MMRMLVALACLLAAAPAASAAPVTYAAIREDLIRWEGWRTRPYRDGAKGWSVGVGHSLSSHREIGRWDRPYTTHEIEQLLARDIAAAWDSCRAGIERFDDLPAEIQLVALGLAFTCGRTGFTRWVNLRRAASYRAYGAMAVELADSRWRTQVSAERFNAYLHTLRSQP